MDVTCKGISFERGRYSILQAGRVKSTQRVVSFASESKHGSNERWRMDLTSREKMFYPPVWQNVDRYPEVSRRAIDQSAGDYWVAVSTDWAAASLLCRLSRSLQPPWFKIAEFREGLPLVLVIPCRFSGKLELWCRSQYNLRRHRYDWFLPVTVAWDDGCCMTAGSNIVAR